MVEVESQPRSRAVDESSHSTAESSRGGDQQPRRTAAHSSCSTTRVMPHSSCSPCVSRPSRARHACRAPLVVPFDLGTDHSARCRVHGARHPLVVLHYTRHAPLVVLAVCVAPQSCSSCLSCPTRCAHRSGHCDHSARWQVYGTHQVSSARRAPPTRRAPPHAPCPTRRARRACRAPVVLVMPVVPHSLCPSTWALTTAPGVECTALATHSSCFTSLVVPHSSCSPCVSRPSRARHACRAPLSVPIDLGTDHSARCRVKGARHPLVVLHPTRCAPLVVLAVRVAPQSCSACLSCPTRCAHRFVIDSRVGHENDDTLRQVSEVCSD